MFVGWWVLAIGALIVCGVIASEAAAQQAAQGRVVVGPSTGYPGTWFRVRFRAPDRAGRVNNMWRYYVIQATGPGGSGGCIGQATKYVNETAAGVRVRVRLTPGRDGWCLGRFQGTVTEQEQPVCPFREVCPSYVVLVRTVGRFTFHVNALPPGGDVTPPVFAGLASAVTCTGGAIRPGERTSYHLTWKPGHDEVTPRSQLVYDIFMSSTPGGENFSSPTWTSRPGANAFTTPKQPVSRTLYFVVRARDQAGNEDQNRVERRGVDPCV
jgi:hypothetical protein